MSLFFVFVFIIWTVQTVLHPLQALEKLKKIGEYLIWYFENVVWIELEGKPSYEHHNSYNEKI